jgi:hypothetical protein
MISQSGLKQLLTYDPETGHFHWTVARGRQPAGSRAGTINGHGYRQIRIDGTIYPEHRLAFLYMLGRWPFPEGEHKDRDRSNSKWDNLRDATHAQNMQNSGSPKSATGVKGVYFEPRTGKYYAQIRCNGERKSVGTFSTLEDAAVARRNATIKHHGQFARF